MDMCKEEIRRGEPVDQGSVRCSTVSYGVGCRGLRGQGLGLVRWHWSKERLGVASGRWGGIRERGERDMCVTVRRDLVTSGQWYS